VPLAAKCLSEAREVVASSLISLLKNGKDYISRWKSLPATQSIRLRSLTGTVSNTSRNIVNELKNGLRAKALTFLKNKAGFISGREEVLDILNPFNVLQRGFTITSVDGIMIKSARQLKEGETIETRFKDARVRSKITRINRAKR
jgi:exonuclease VII large subunit